MKTIVVLGAGLAAAPLIRQLMRNTVLGRNDVRLVVVAPTTHFHWPIAMPRVIVPGQMADEKVLFPLGPIFGQYPADKFEFVLGRASALDPSAKVVTVAYDVLVVATGASASGDMPWKLVGAAGRTVERIRSLQQDIRGARTVVVTGGGPTGAEVAGELGFEYARSGRKDVYLVHSGDLPLVPPTLPGVRKQVRTVLERMKVKVVANTTVASATRSGADTVLELRHADGSTRTLRAQAYLPATGVRPNTSFLPAGMLDDGSYVRQTTTLQADGFADDEDVGDAGSLEASKAAAADAQARHLIKALPMHLDGGRLPEYTPDPKEMLGVTLGRSRATGQMGSLKLWSFLLWYLKGRFLGTDYADQYAAGKRTLMSTFEKGREPWSGA